MKQHGNKIVLSPLELKEQRRLLSQSLRTPNEADAEELYARILTMLSHPAAIARGRMVKGTQTRQYLLNGVIICRKLSWILYMLILFLSIEYSLYILISIPILFFINHFGLNHFQTKLNIELAARLILLDSLLENGLALRQNGLTTSEMEQRILEAFLRDYSDGSFKLISKREKPDWHIKCRTSGREIFVETTLAVFEETLNLSARKAMMRSGAFLPPDMLDRLERGDVTEDEKDQIVEQYMGMGHSGEILAEVLRGRINDKIEKYDGYDRRFPIILVIGIGDHGFGKSSVNDFVLPALNLPQNTPFYEIWVCVFLHLVPADRGIIQIK